MSRAGRRGPRVRNLAAEQPDARQPRLIREPLRAVSDDELENIHHASLRVLAEIGIDFLLPEARRLLHAAGATVDAATERVRFDPELVEALISTAPSEFALHGGAAHRDLHIGGDWITFGCVASAPNIAERSTGRRSGDRKGFQDLTKLAQVLNPVHCFPGGYPVEPIDVHPSVRHLEAAWDGLTLSDKPTHVYSLGAQRNRDVIEMVRIYRGVSDVELDRQPSLMSVINASSPLRYDLPMLEGIVEMATRNQVLIITPFTLAGAMAPITIPGAIVQQNAEALAGIAFTQVVNPGAPVMYGGFTSNVDMRSGAPAFGTPEYATAALLGGQLARRYGVPYRSSGVSASNAVDAQAGYETMWALMGAVLGGANMILHAAGWMEGGLHASPEKMVVDADLLNMVSTFLRPIDATVEALDLAVEAIAEVGPAGHFFATQHTQDRYTSEFYSPLVSDWRNWETWTEAGQPDAWERAERLAQEFIAGHVEPPMPAERRAELREFVDRRIAEGGVPTDY